MQASALCRLSARFCITSPHSQATSACTSWDDVVDADSGIASLSLTLLQPLPGDEVLTIGGPWPLPNASVPNEGVPILCPLGGIGWARGKRG